MNATRPEMAEDDLEGFKYFKQVLKLLERFHDVAGARDRAGNRRLFMDQYLALLVFACFNPITQSLRGLQQASELKKVQRVLGVPRASLGSLSEAAQVFDASLLVGLIGDLVHQLPPLRYDADLQREVRAVITLVDGTWLEALPALVEWAYQRKGRPRAKAHIQFELVRGVPVAADITPATTGETAVLRDRLEPNRAYVLDRGYADYRLLEAIRRADSHFVCRLRNNAFFAVLQDRPLTPEATAAGVRRDRVVRLGCLPGRNHLTAPVRIVEVAARAHPKRPADAGPAEGDRLLIATDLMDLPAETVALLYRCRWQIELFFRTFKHVLGCRHLLSHSQNGIALQTYVAIVVCLLIALWTGRQPTLRTCEMIGWLLLGWADEDELLAHIAGLQDTAEAA
jgi:hypothetical protein